MRCEWGATAPEAPPQQLLGLTAREAPPGWRLAARSRWLVTDLVALGVGITVRGKKVCYRARTCTTMARAVINTSHHLHTGLAGLRSDGTRPICRQQFCRRNQRAKSRRTRCWSGRGAAAQSQSSCASDPALCAMCA